LANLKTTYESTKPVKSAKLEMLIYRFEEIKMLEEDTFGEFDTKINDLRNSMVNLGKTVLDVKLIRKILRSLPERFRIKVTTIEERKDLDEMKIEELVGSLQSYEYSLPLVKKAKTIALKESKKKAMLAKNFGRLMKNDKFTKKFTERLKKAPRESEPEEAEKKDPRGPRCFECSGFGQILGISSRLKGRPTMRLSMMSQKKKKKLLLKIRNF
jgi:hypothetical protein